MAAAVEALVAFPSLVAAAELLRRSTSLALLTALDPAVLVEAAKEEADFLKETASAAR